MCLFRMDHAIALGNDLDDPRSAFEWRARFYQMEAELQDDIDYYRY